MNKIIVKKLRESAIIPTKGSDKAAAYDLYACIDDKIIIKPGECKKIGTGVSFAPPENVHGFIFARSGMGVKRGLRPGNCVGVCDNDYTGEYIVGLYNDSTEEQYIYPDDRIAQVIFMQIPSFEIEEGEVEETKRGDGGFGSTGQ